MHGKKPCHQKLGKFMTAKTQNRQKFTLLKVKHHKFVRSYQIMVRYGYSME